MNPIIVIWYIPQKNSYYFRRYNCVYYKPYEVGYVNGYGHEIVLIIDLVPFEKVSMKNRLINGAIHFLEKFRK